MKPPMPLLIRGDARSLPLPDSSVDCVITSPPYFALRSYVDGGEHYAGQIGSETTPAEWLDVMIECTREMVRVLKPSGSIFVNQGDKYVNPSTSGAHRGGNVQAATYSDHKPVPGFVPKGMRPKSLMLLPERYRIRCVDELGLIARAVIVWHKPNGLPESVTDRVRRSHEDWVHLTKQPRYYSAVDEIREPHAEKTLTHRGGGQSWGNERNPDNNWRDPKVRRIDPLGKTPGSVWTIATQQLTVPPELGIDHYAVFPMALPRRLIIGWCPREVCTACGQGRRPVADKRYLSPTQAGWDYKAPDTWSGSQDNPRERRADGTFLPRPEYVNRGALHGRGAAVARMGDGSRVTITGYACVCPDTTAPTTPGVVLDPFGGTSTTSLVATMLGRVGISVELSADYCRLARWRAGDPKERARAAGFDPGTVAAIKAPPADQLDLFGEVS